MQKMQVSQYPNAQQSILSSPLPSGSATCTVISRNSLPVKAFPMYPPFQPSRSRQLYVVFLTQSNEAMRATIRLTSGVVAIMGFLVVLCFFKGMYKERNGAAVLARKWWCYMGALPSNQGELCEISFACRKRMNSRIKKLCVTSHWNLLMLALCPCPSKSSSSRRHCRGHVRRYNRRPCPEYSNGCSCRASGTGGS